MRKLLTSLSIFVFAFLTIGITSVSAKVISNQNGPVTVAKNEVINDDLFIGAQSAEIDGTVNGDVFIGAQKVVITGVINGNLHVGAQSVNLSGKVTGNSYIGTQDINLSKASIGGSLLVGSQNVSIDRDTIIGGSLLVGAANASIDSQIKRSAYLGTANMTLGSDTKIGKDLYYAADNKRGTVNIASTAVIKGNTYKSEVNVNTGKEVIAVKNEAPKMFGGFKLASEIISYVGAIIIGLLYFKLFKKHSSQVIEIISNSFWKSLGIGFLIIIAFVPALIILALTIVGLPLAGITLLVLLTYFYLAKIVVAVSFGQWMVNKFKWKWSNFMVFAIGLLVFYVLKMIPIVGFITGLAVLWSGLGAFGLQIFSKEK